MKIISLFLLIFTIQTAAQQISFPSVGLQGINFSVKITEIPDSIKTISLLFSENNYSRKFVFGVRNREIDTFIAVDRPGKYKIIIKEIPSAETEFNIIPDFLSIIPPVAAIFLALIFRQVIVSLVLGIYFGAVMLNNFNPLISLLRVVDTYVINSVSDPSHAKVLVFTFLFGGVVGLMNKSGGTRGIANLVVNFAKTRRNGMISTWLAGLIIFFDDYANTLIVGNLMRPITDKLKISREKLAFIVDSTSAPVASLFIVSTWIGFEIGLIQDGLNATGLNANAYDIFLNTIPYRFYPIGILFFVILISYTQRDFGAMLRAEKRAILNGDNGYHNLSSKTLDSELFGNSDKARWYNGIVPLAILLFGTVAGLFYTGIDNLETKGISNFGISEIISNADPYISLLWSGFAAAIVSVIMILLQKIMNLHDSLEAWYGGVKSMLFALIILTLAWAIGTITVELHTADYIISLISDKIDPRFLPVLVFIVCALTSFSTGTSWGTMAIMMPIVIPLSHSVSGLYSLSSPESSVILYGVVSSVLAGSVFGDHCSPIADTTILSSMASGCDHMAHVSTQLPYAFVTAIVCMIIGDIPTAFGLSPYISIFLIFVALAGVNYFIGRKVT